LVEPIDTLAVSIAYDKGERHVKCGA
jgi:hypothetical protein